MVFFHRPAAQLWRDWCVDRRLSGRHTFQALDDVTPKHP
jgi:hypothetical protein